MALVLAYEDAKVHQRTRSGTVVRNGIEEPATNTPFFGWRDKPELPHAKMVQHARGHVSGTHFHVVDQFQVVLDGKGTLGRSDYSPYTVHFSRAHTPYGPLIANNDTGFTHFGLRPHYDPGAQNLPAARDKLKQVADRDPWQITRGVSFPRQSDADVMLQADPHIRDDRGLAVYTLMMKPNARTVAPDPSRGDGQYVLAVKGSFIHEGKEQRAAALVYVYPHESAFPIQAGPEGLEAFVLNFPERRARTAGAALDAKTATGLKRWQCALCAFAYDEAAGLPDEGIAPGTRWQDVPESWSCPDCAATKSDFQMVEIS